MAAGNTSTRSLEYTPTWAVAAVCFVFITISIIIEHSIHLLTNWLQRRRKIALFDAVERLKSELVLLGFISLLLAVIQKPISDICISSKVADTMLPCSKEAETQTLKLQLSQHIVTAIVGNSSLRNGFYDIRRRPYRGLAEDEGGDDENSVSKETDKCSSQGKVSLVAEEGIHQLHMFIFVLAVMQIVYCVVTMGLGTAKMRRWKAWEKETQTIEYEAANDPYRFRFTRQTTFGKRHMTTCTETSLHLWIRSFFRLFFNSVAKVDYLTLRHGFILAHLSARNNTNFNFHKYINRSLEEDFKIVVGISPLMWLTVVIFLLVDVHGWRVYLWMSCVPLFIVLVVGTKLEIIVARMALQINNRNGVVIGTPLVQPNDNFFWFGHPKFVLTLLHYSLFLSAFELAFLIWATLEFGVKSCYQEHTIMIITRVLLPVTAQVICSYITLPLYALVTQMGSQYQSKVKLEGQIAKIMKQWHAEVRERRKQQSLASQSPRTSLSSEWSPISRSPNEFSSLRPYSSLPSDSTHHYGKGEITEEDEDDSIRNRAGSSRPPLQTGMLELPMVRQDMN